MAYRKIPDGNGDHFTKCAVPYAASVTLDLSRARRPLFTIIVTGDITMLRPINGFSGQIFAIRFTQANGGGHSVTWDAGSDWRGSDTSALPTLSSTNDDDDAFAFLVNGDRDTFDYSAGVKGLS